MRSTPPTKTYRDVPSWVPILIVAVGGLLSSWMSYDRGGAVMAVELRVVREVVKAHETKIDDLEKKVTFLEAKHSH